MHVGHKLQLRNFNYLQIPRKAFVSKLVKPNTWDMEGHRR